MLIIKLEECYYSVYLQDAEDDQTIQSSPCHLYCISVKRGLLL
jgi:hypothetical protein